MSLGAGVEQLLFSGKLMKKVYEVIEKRCIDFNGGFICPSCRKLLVPVRFETCSKKPKLESEDEIGALLPSLKEGASRRQS